MVLLSMKYAELLLIYQPKILLIPCVVCRIIEKMVLEKKKFGGKLIDFSQSSFKQLVGSFSFLVLSYSEDL